ncbi:MAG TPA: glycosyltransferase family 2 protein [Opitutaceae bacterium]|nr:glycosyltransferase family 2 protein [Opitutaceae bacterium]
MALIRIYLFTCRRPSLLPRALASLRAQTFTDWICELHNDAPDDPFPAELVRRASDPRLILRPHEHNLGAVAAFNLAFAPVSERFVSLLEDDNWWEPELLARLVAELEARPECEVAWANMRLWREETTGEWTDMGKTIWPPVDRPALTLAWPQPLQLDSPLHSHGAMLVRATAVERLRVPPITPLDIIEPFRERLFRYPLVFLPEPLANFALTRKTARSTGAGRWLESQTLQAASFLRHAAQLDPAGRAHLWQTRREASPPATAPLFFAGLLEWRTGFLRGATMRDWWRFFLGLVRHPWLAARTLTVRRRQSALWEALAQATREAGRRPGLSADIAGGLLASRSDLRRAVDSS